MFSTIRRGPTNRLRSEEGRQWLCQAVMTLLLSGLEASLASTDCPENRQSAGTSQSPLMVQQLIRVRIILEFKGRQTFSAVAPGKAAWVVRDKLHFTSASIAGAELILGDLLHRIFFKNFFKGIPIPYTPIMLCKISKIS